MTSKINKCKKLLKNKINWSGLSLNENAIELLKNNKDKIKTKNKFKPFWKQSAAPLEPNIP